MDKKRAAKDRDVKRRQRDTKHHDSLDAALELGLEESFPGSDPAAVTQPPHSPYDKNEAKRR
jgi:hypothetical protein